MLHETLVRRRASGASLAALAAAIIGGCTGSIVEPASSSSRTSGGSAGGGPAGTGTPASRSAANCALPAARIWKLTPRQYDSSLRALLASAPSAQSPLEAVLPLGKRKFSNEADHNDMSTPYVTELFGQAEAAAAALADNPGRIAPCLAQGMTADSQCLSGAFSSLLERAYRRPPAPSEVSALVQYVGQRAPVDGDKTALREAIQGVLTSPSFLFRTELGAPGDTAATFELDPYEKASALSYFLLDGPPDDQLRMAAASGNLGDLAGLEQEARRLLQSPAAAGGLLRFFSEYTQDYMVTTASKDSSVYPDFDVALAGDMDAETGAFVSHVLGQDDGRLHTLFDAPYSVVSPRLAKLYGVTITGAGWTKADFAADTRAGILTQAAFLTVQATATRGNPVKRGKFIRQRLLCATVSAPPPKVPSLPAADPGAQNLRTMRQRLEQHSKDPACSGCHQLMDPLGLPLERYDGIGRYRLREGSDLIDPGGTLYGYGDPVPFKDAVEMAHVLGAHPAVQSCFVESVFSYAHGRAPSEADACELDRLKARFQQTNGQVSALVVDAVTSDHFTHRRRVP